MDEEGLVAARKRECTVDRRIREGVPEPPDLVIKLEIFFFLEVQVQ